MVLVFLENIQDFDLPLDTTEKIVKRGKSKRILKGLEKKYRLKSHHVCRKMFDTYELYANAANSYVPEEDKKLWIVNYEIYVRSSAYYKFLVYYFKFFFTWVQNLKQHI